MDKLNLALQAEPQANFVDASFKSNPGGSGLDNFNQWQQVEGFLPMYGEQVREEGALNGGSSHGSQTAVGSPHRGYGDTNGSGNTGSNSSDMQDVNSPDPPGADSGVSGRGARQKRDTLRALNKLAQQRYRERERQKLESLKQRRSDYSQTLDSLHAASHANQQLEAENQRLAEQLQQLNASDSVSSIQPKAPLSASENGYSGESDNSSNSPYLFPTRVGQDIPTTASHKTEYERTEQEWFKKIHELRECMQQLGFWNAGPVQGPDLSKLGDKAVINQLVGALEGVVGLCCKVAQMEGLEINNILERTEQTCSDLQSWKEPDRWLTAARDVQLSKEQTKSFSDLRTACLDILKRIYTQRQELSAAVVNNLVPSDENVDPANKGQVNLNQVMLQLEENLKEEQRFNCQMLYTVFKFLLNPVQAGWLILKSFPEHVDVLAFMNAVVVLQRPKHSSV